MKRFLLLLLLGLASLNPASAETILFESGTLGQTGIPREDVANQVVLGVNISPAAFNGVRFNIAKPVVTEKVGGHFVGPPSGRSFFGAIVQLDDENDLPDSGDLSTPDVLDHTLLTFPEPSAEVFGDLNLSLAPGWYALVFGSGLFGATGDGAAPLNNPNIGNPTYIGSQNGNDWGVLISPLFTDMRFVVKGAVVPEPTKTALCLTAILCLLSQSRIK